MKTILSLGTCSINILYPLGYILTVSLVEKLAMYIKTEIKTNFYVITTFGPMFLAEIMGGCLYFIYWYQKQNYNLISRESNMIVHTMPKMKSISSETKYSFALIFYLLMLPFTDILIVLLVQFNHNYSNSTLIELEHFMFFVYIILSIFLLHQQIYSHHYTSIGVSVLGLILMIIPMTEKEYKWISVSLQLVVNVLSAFLIFSEKWMMHFKRINPYFILLLQGISGLFITSVILIVIFTSCPSNPNKNQWYCNDVYFYSKLDLNGIGYLFVQLFDLLSLNICLVQTLNYFTPLYYLSAHVLSYLIDWIIDVIAKKQKFDYYPFFGYLLLIIAFLIFNETIILHFCKLDFNTTMMITQRSVLNFLLDEVYKVNELSKTLDVEEV